MIELKIRISNSEKNLVKKFPIYQEEFLVSKNNPTLKKLVEEAISEFKDEYDDVQIRTFCYYS